MTLADTRDRNNMPKSARKSKPCTTARGRKASLRHTIAPIPRTPLTRLRRVRGWTNGQRVRVRWTDGKYYDARVATHRPRVPKERQELNTGRVAVCFEGGEWDLVDPLNLQPLGAEEEVKEQEDESRTDKESNEGTSVSSDSDAAWSETESSLSRSSDGQANIGIAGTGMEGDYMGMIDPGQKGHTHVDAIQRRIKGIGGPLQHACVRGDHWADFMHPETEEARVAVIVTRCDCCMARKPTTHQFKRRERWYRVGKDCARKIRAARGLEQWKDKYVTGQSRCFESAMSEWDAVATEAALAHAV